MFFLGGNGEKGTPVLIPNTEVKFFSADGTTLATGRESRSPPRQSIQTNLSLLLLTKGFFCNKNSYSFLL
jgi:hypothetical protein